MFLNLHSLAMTPHNIFMATRFFILTLLYKKKIQNTYFFFVVPSPKQYLPFNPIKDIACKIS